MNVQDSLFIRRAASLAEKGLGRVSPNPMVGAIVVSGTGVVLGEGYHQCYGEAHAEVNAIKDVEQRYPDALHLLKHATMYVTLEPCSHFGKTPPCADLIIEKGIKRVVIGCKDSHSKVSGRGIERLKEAGVEVLVGVEEDLCRFLNRRFFTTVEKQRPYMILNWAETQDGFIAPLPKARRQISGDVANFVGHQWRAEEDAILVGKNTALIDNPQLNVRHIEGRNPIRVVIDPNLELLEGCHLLNQEQVTLVFNAQKEDKNNQVTYIKLEDFRNYLPQQIVYQLYLMDIQSVIVEGGAQTLALFIDTGLWDEARVLKSLDVQFGEGLAAPILPLAPQESITIGRDILNMYYAV